MSQALSPNSLWAWDASPPAGTVVKKIIQQHVLSSGSFAGKSGELGLAAEPDKRAAALVPCFYSRAWLVSPQRPGALLLKMNFKKTGIDVTLV